MARSPFQGTHQYGGRPVVVTAPDALVRINGESDILGCSKCRKRFDWNKYITGINLDLNVDSAPGSASINLSVPRHAIDDLYVDGKCLITPMMEIEIYGKGYFLVEGIPQMYPIFWGLVTEVSNSYSNGEHTISINCADILKWWELCMMNVNPAFTGVKGQGGTSVFGNVFFGMNPYDVIWTLAQQSFGDIVVGTGSLTSLVNEKNPAFQDTFRSALVDIMQYWNQRFSKIRSNLMLYGVSGNAVRGDVLQAAYQNRKPGFGKPFASQVVRQANGNTAAQMDFDPTDPRVTAFRTQFQQAGQVNFWQSEYQTKLEMANLCKEAIGFEFYMDVTGDIVFKPPFYNLDILSNKPVSWIQDIDIINWDDSHSEAEVVTQIQMQGSYAGNIDYGLSEEVTPYTSVVDYNLLRKYGWRSRTYNSEFMGNPRLVFYVGLDMLDRFNSKRFRMSITIPFRPELRMGFPIYVAPLDQIWYIQGISHNVTFGSQATTTLTLTAKREKFIAPRGIGTLELVSFKGGWKQSDVASNDLSASQISLGGSFKVDLGEAAQVPATTSAPNTTDPYAPLILKHPKTGRIVGYPNVVMVSADPYEPSADELADAMGQKRASDPRTVQSRQKTRDKAALTQVEKIAQTLTHTSEDEIRTKHLNNRYRYGLDSAGVSTYVYDKSKVVKEMLLIPGKNLSGKDGTTPSFQTGMVRPVSDERGFEVIGHHRYGRGVSLRDGALIVDSESQVQIGTQLALSGGLYETLQAQSHGLTTAQTGYSNPAEVVARLAPEDLQTAGIINPDTKKPEYVTTGTNFISSATLNSFEQTGGYTPPNVEAAQLSRALTLAEMSVQSAELSSVCECVTSRSDLAFLNVGYQIQFMRDTASAEDLTNQGRDLLSQAHLDAQNDPRVLLGEMTLEEVASEYANAAAASSSPQLQQVVADLQQGDPNDVVGYNSPVLENKITTNKVELFLANLYRDLDTPHQQYEKELRGEFLRGDNRTEEQVRFGAPTDDRTALEPPYSVPTRTLGGDPRTIGLEAKSALNQTAKVWDEFGNKLKSESEKAKLQGEIDRSQARITAMEAEKSKLETALSTNGVVILPGGNSAREQIRELQKSIDIEIHNMNNNQTKYDLIVQKGST